MWPGVRIAVSETPPSVDDVAVLQHDVHLHRFEVRLGALAEQVVGDAAVRDEAFVALHDADAGVAQRLEVRQRPDVIEVRLRRQQDPDLLGLEAEGADRLLDLARHARHGAVDQDVAGRRRDQVGGEILGADVVDRADDLEGRDRRRPRRIVGVDLRRRLLRCRAAAQRPRARRIRSAAGEPRAAGDPGAGRYREYSTDEQRRATGCIARLQRDFHRGLLDQARASSAFQRS